MVEAGRSMTETVVVALEVCCRREERKHSRLRRRNWKNDECMGVACR